MPSLPLESAAIVLFIIVVWELVIVFYILVLPRLLEILEEF